MGERTINVNAEWYETVTAELKAKDKRIAELEAKHTALVDGLRWTLMLMASSNYKKRDIETKLRALLGKEND